MQGMLCAHVTKPDAVRPGWVTQQTEYSWKQYMLFATQQHSRLCNYHDLDHKILNT
jgi:hypothetical protein